MRNGMLKIIFRAKKTAVNLTAGTNFQTNQNPKSLYLLLFHVLLISDTKIRAGTVALCDANHNGQFFFKRKLLFISWFFVFL